MRRGEIWGSVGVGSCELEREQKMRLPNYTKVVQLTIVGSVLLMTLVDYSSSTVPMGVRTWS